MRWERGKKWLLWFWKLLVVGLVNWMVYLMLAAGGSLGR